MRTLDGENYCILTDNTYILTAFATFSLFGLIPNGETPWKKLRFARFLLGGSHRDVLELGRGDRGTMVAISGVAKEHKNPYVMRFTSTKVSS